MDWVIKDGESSLNRSTISIAKTGISQIINAETKQQFIVGLINGVGQQLKSEYRQAFTEKVFEWADETPPPFALKLYYDSDREVIDSYHTDPQISIDDVHNGICLVKTGQVLKYLDIIKLFLEGNDDGHFLMMGLHGSAKR